MQNATRNRLLGTGALGAIVLATLVGPNASAVVVQVNGEIIPDCADNISVALARGELAGNAGGSCPSAFPLGSPACWSQTATAGANCLTRQVTNNAGNTGSQGPLNPVNDASTDPQVFVIPKVPGAGNTTVFGQVTATFLWRNTAGYRNSFGWYNVGDDVTNLNNLHPILPSWPPPTGKGGVPFDQAGVATNAPFQVTVDFQTEFTNNNYKGGFVGFYLMTPQGQAGTGGFPNYDGCSQFSDPPANTDGHARGYYPYVNYNAAATGAAPPANSCVGYMYFTERALNGDGNYVHSLILQTKVLDTNKVRYSDFYFTFEDTYRSSDIGYSDNTLFVQGLVTPCIPSPETCNGQDDDCDGVIDNNPVDAGGACTQIAGDHPGVGICKAGTLVCRLPTGTPGTPGHGSNDVLVCDGEIGPSPESCNGNDDDCDGKVDDPNGVVDPTKQVWGPATGSVAIPNQCASLLGACKGSTECVNGAPACVDTTGPAPETCNGNDDDCDGIIDDNPSDAGQPCYPPGGTPVGICKAGLTVCLPGNNASDKLSCQGYIGPEPHELCDGLDNDCNGKVDDNPIDVGEPCTPTGVSGVCNQGKIECVNGARVCAGFGFGKPETCNGLDDDCDGTIDDNPVDAGIPCGSAVGACKQGVLSCRPPGGVADTPGHDPGDKLICDGATGPTAEQCDGIDNDCNGIVDDGTDGTANTLPGVGVTCTTTCGTGKTVCKDGAIQCVGTGGGTVETCNGIDDDCNGIIDDNPIDAGGPCGTVVIDPSVKQNPACALGTEVCRLATGTAGTPGHSVGDVLECDGQVGGDSETCNGIDDDCNGVVDDNVPGQGVECAPGGLTLPLQGECKPGKLFCIDGSMQCEGGIGPQALVCDGKDHDCNGQVDIGPCKDASNKCINGVCRVPCGSGEFTNCPGGTTCGGGYCIPNDCTGQCIGTDVCNLTTGACEPAKGGGTTLPDGGKTLSGNDAGNAGAGGASQSGPDGGSIGGASGSPAGIGGEGTKAITNPQPFGLATGGGGCACRTTPRRASGEPLLGAALLGLATLRRRRTRRALQGGRR